MSKVFIIQPSTLEQREVTESEADRAEKELGWVRKGGANELVSVFHPGRVDHKSVLRQDVTHWEQKGYFAEPTVVYHPDEGEMTVAATQAQEMLTQGWYDSPAKFPGRNQGVATLKGKKTA